MIVQFDNNFRRHITIGLLFCKSFCKASSTREKKMQFQKNFRKLHNFSLKNVCSVKESLFLKKKFANFFLKCVFFFLLCGRSLSFAKLLGVQYSDYILLHFLDPIYRKSKDFKNQKFQQKVCNTLPYLLVKKLKTYLRLFIVYI